MERKAHLRSPIRKRSSASTSLSMQYRHGVAPNQGAEADPQRHISSGFVSRSHVKTIVCDLKETYPCMRNSEILAYLSGIEGIREAISEDTLAEWLSSV